MPVSTPSASHTYNFYPTRTVAEFIRSEATISILYGPMGEGKTLGGIARIFYRASLLKHHLLPGQSYGVMIVRDTHENNKHSVVKTFTQEWFPRYPMEHLWRNDFKQLHIASDPPIDIELYGIDDVAALTKLQGAVGTSLIWLEEVAPYTDSFRTNAGISEDVYNAALVRCARQAGVPASLQLTFNPPDEDHWSFNRLLAPVDGPVSPLTPLIKKQVFKIKSGENTYLPEEARQATIAAYLDDPAATARFVRGETATKYPGKKVATNFNENWHVSQTALHPFDGATGWISFDSWGHPAAVMGQQMPNGRLLVLDVLNMSDDIPSIITHEVFPRLEHPRWKGKCREWRYMGDYTMQQPDQSNITTSAAIKVEEMFSDHDSGQVAFFEPGPHLWEHRRAGLLYALKWTIGGEPAVIIDPVHCKKLIAALKGRWHFPVNKSGVVNYNSPVKDDFSHVADAFTDALCVLSPYSAPRGNVRRRGRIKAAEQDRARSYATT